MKKLIIAVLAIGAFSACTKSSVLYEQPGEISIRPVAAKATKAAVDGVYYPISNDFNVWAWWGNVPAGTELDAFPAYPEIYIHDGTFAFEYSYGAWRGNTPYYWPTEGSLVFAGYSPASAYDDALLFNYRWTEKIFEIRGYKQSTDILKTNDLMWFDATVRSYSDNGAVPVVFHHILSWLTFTFQLKEGVQSSHTVTNVKLTGIETEARFTSKPAAGNPEWTDHYLTDEVQIWSGSQDLSSTPVTLESTTDGVLVIPQSCANENAQLEITYYVGNDSSDLKTKILYLTYFTEGEDGNVNNVWEPGKHYIYNIIFSADNEILVMPEVDDWITETVDIEIQ